MDGAHENQRIQPNTLYPAMSLKAVQPIPYKRMIFLKVSLEEDEPQRSSFEGYTTKSIPLNLQMSWRGWLPNHPTPSFMEWQDCSGKKRRIQYKHRASPISRQQSTHPMQQATILGSGYRSHTYHTYIHILTWDWYTTLIRSSGNHPGPDTDIASCH